MSIFLIVNPAAGSKPGPESAALEKLFGSHGLHPVIRFVEKGTNVRDLVQTALQTGATTIVAAGGDGTVLSVASALVDENAALGVLPTGTLNHFGRDVGIPTDLEEAVRVIAAGRSIRVDVGEVNGRTFLNNASFGFYPATVREREWVQRNAGTGKWLAMAWATLKVGLRYPTWVVRLRSDGEERLLKTPFVFVGNNEYLVDGLSIGTRQSLQAGRLHLCAGRPTGRWGLIRLVLGAATGKLAAGSDFETLMTNEVVVETRRRWVRLALDGEVNTFAPPLHFVVRPRALAVLSSLGTKQSATGERRNADDCALV